MQAEPKGHINDSENERIITDNATHAPSEGQL